MTVGDGRNRCSCPGPGQICRVSLYVSYGLAVDIDLGTPEWPKSRIISSLFEVLGVTLSNMTSKEVQYQANLGKCKGWPQSINPMFPERKTNNSHPPTIQTPNLAILLLIDITFSRKGIPFAENSGCLVHVLFTSCKFFSKCFKMLFGETWFHRGGPSTFHFRRINSASMFASLEPPCFQEWILNYQFMLLTKRNVREYLDVPLYQSTLWEIPI